MTRPPLSPQSLRTALDGGLMAFPLTDFDADDRFDPAGFAARIDWMGGQGAAALFVAGGAGEFFSLAPDEHDAILKTALAAAPRQPVIAATGYGTAMATELAARSERNGADGLLLLPPYLTETSQEGLFHHIRAVCAATGLGVIVYNRANCRIGADTLLRLLDACPNLVGFKDGVGDTEEFLRMRALAGDRVTWINGMPTAEAHALAYAGMGVTGYTSAIYNFAPAAAMAVHRAVRAGDSARVLAFVRDFLGPYGRLRARGAGYAVSIVKAAVEIIGRSAGPVRPPLSPLTPAEVAELAALIARLDTLELAA